MSREERRRVLAENTRRRQQATDRYAPWNPAERLMVDERRRVAARMLHQARAFPGETACCLEVGFGDGGWLPELLAWGVAEANLHGAEIDPRRCLLTHRRLPSTHLVATGGQRLPYADETFELVIVSTVFSSILVDSVRRQLADEITRVLRSGGVLLWYDFAVDNPANRQVRGVSVTELRELFPSLEGEVRRVTLAPPLARVVAPWSTALATLIGTMPWLRTHRLGVLKKGPLAH